MKTINRNNNDEYFINKETIDNSLKRKPRITNKKQTITAALLIGGLIVSAGSIYEFSSDIFETIDYEKTIQRNKDSVNSSNYNLIKESNQNGEICVFDSNANIEQEYSIINKHLYNKDGEEISLKNRDDKISLISCNIDEELLDNINLSESLTKTLVLNSSSIDNNAINYFPSTITALSLDDCNYITSLDNLSKKCPNINYLSIDKTDSLSDLSFIYKMKDLKEIFIKESAYITKDLINYLDSNNIKHNLTEEDLYNSIKTDEIINTIIKPSMDNDEKIRSICKYVIDNIEYNENLFLESNENPLTYALKEKSGVCSSYAYLTSVLLNKAGIDSYRISNNDHTWNLVELNNKYYYIDNTEKDTKSLYNGILECLHLSDNYVANTDVTFTSQATDPQDKRTIIPTSLIEDIKNSEEDKSIIEKYRGKLPNYSIILASILAGISIGLAPTLIKGTYKKAKEVFKENNDTDKVHNSKHR
ncbi:MAG: hypothetical protein IJI43_04290 [Bacilli bacterium]|nr:hypothetical protein [Bacilli bacterium]